MEGWKFQNVSVQLFFSIIFIEEEIMGSFNMRRCQVILWAILFIIMALMVSPVSAGEKVKLEGEIRGAKCTHYQVECFNDDNHIALEPDFVFVLPDGQYYFMPNIGRAVKARHAYKNVRIHGELTRQELWVDKLVDLDRKKGSRSKTTWDWTDQDEFWESR